MKITTLASIIERLEQARKADSDNAFVHFYLSLAYEKQNKPHQAKLALRRHKRLLEAALRRQR